MALNVQTRSRSLGNYENCSRRVGSQVGDVVCSEAAISRLSGSHCVDVDLHVVRELLRNNYRDLHDRERVNDHLLRTELIFSLRRKRGREVGTFVPVIRSINRSSIFIFLAFIRLAFVVRWKFKFAAPISRLRSCPIVDLQFYQRRRNLLL